MKRKINVEMKLHTRIGDTNAVYSYIFKIFDLLCVKLQIFLLNCN
jgi:hypothetical protein